MKVLNIYFKITANTIKTVLLSLVFILLISTSIFSQSLYSSTAYTSRFNPGVGSLGTPIVAYDDVTIPSAIGEGSDSISITKIKVGIRRVPNAPATNVNLYYTTFQDDSTADNTMKKAAHVFLGKVSLPVNGSSLVTSVISLGDSVSALFKIKTDANVANNGYQKFLIGASFDNPSTGNGIILTKTPDNNVDSVWIDNSDNDKALYATSFSGHLPATYYLEVFGSAANKQMKDERNTFSDVAVNRNIDVNTTK
ncbi:MAG: hypothetical protein JWQ09_4749 [Segetibacter sp.]|nr:hypothetical protein [Segetibacter sp.]